MLQEYQSLIGPKRLVHPSVMLRLSLLALLVAGCGHCDPASDNGCCHATFSSGSNANSDDLYATHSTWSANATNWSFSASDGKRHLDGTIAQTGPARDTLTLVPSPQPTDSALSYVEDVPSFGGDQNQWDVGGSLVIDSISGSRVQLHTVQASGAPGSGGRYNEASGTFKFQLSCSLNGS
jgi:hypothetical protein